MTKQFQTYPTYLKNIVVIMKYVKPEFTATGAWDRFFKINIVIINI